MLINKIYLLSKDFESLRKTKDNINNGLLSIDEKISYAISIHERVPCQKVVDYIGNFRNDNFKFYL